MPGAVMGRCDDCGFEKSLSEKNNINVLKPDEELLKAIRLPSTDLIILRIHNISSQTIKKSADQTVIRELFDPADLLFYLYFTD